MTKTSTSSTASRPSGAGSPTRPHVKPTLSGQPQAAAHGTGKLRMALGVALGRRLSAADQPAAPGNTRALKASRSPLNPQFPLSIAQARKELRRMKVEPALPVRPVVVLSGYHSPHAQAEHLRWVLQRHTHADATLVAVSYTTRTKMAQIIADAAASITKRFGAGAEVDLVCISMGGLIARAICTPGALPSAAGEIPTRTPINAQRVFTLASPHAGALLADKIAPNAAARDMKRASTFLTALDLAQPAAKYELVCYSRLRDGWVGAQRSAPPGHGVVWTSGAVWGSHFTVTWDPRIIADLCRRVRGEAPLGAPSTPPRN